MRRAILRFSNLAASLGITGLFAIGYPADVRAQAIFCPTTLPLTNGSCTNGVDGAFRAPRWPVRRLAKYLRRRPKDHEGNRQSFVARRAREGGVRRKSRSQRRST